MLKNYYEPQENETICQWINRCRPSCCRDEITELRFVNYEFRAISAKWSIAINGADDNLCASWDSPEMGCTYLLYTDGTRKTLLGAELQVVEGWYRPLEKSA